MPPENMQLSSSIIALLSGLVGSILTIAVSKVLDLIQKRQEHKYALRKAFFEKKLQVAEAMVGNLQKTINIFRPLSTVLRKIPDFVTQGTPRDFLESQMQTISSQAQKILQETGDCSYAAQLYFDVGKLNNIISLCYEKMLNCAIMYALLEKKARSITPESVSKTDLEEIVNQYSELLKDMTLTIDSLKTSMDTFISAIRDEMKEYEP